MPPTRTNSSGSRLIRPPTPALTPPAPNIPCKPGDKFNSTTGLPCVTTLPIQPAPNAPQCSIVNTLGVGWYGPEVKCLQTILRITSDGIFGPKTKTAVIKFQTANGLKVDGIVGPKTKGEMNIP